MFKTLGIELRLGHLNTVQARFLEYLTRLRWPVKFVFSFPVKQPVYRRIKRCF